MSDLRRGRCLCGAVRFEYDGAEIWRGYCHCESCRRATSSPVTAFVAVARARHRFTAAEPAAYCSSPGVRRLFCGRCGSPVAYDAEHHRDEIHLFLAALEDASAPGPEVHFHHAERLPWFETADDLPRQPGFEAP